MSQNIVLDFNVEQEVEKIVRQLQRLPNQLKAPAVLARAMNSTATEMKRLLGMHTRKKYAITDTRILKDKDRGGLYVEKANRNEPVAGLISKGSMVDVMAYMTRKNTGAEAAMLKVLNANNLTALEVDGRKAFVATFKSGHTAIVQRKCEERLPIKKLLAPAVPIAYGKSYAEAELDYYAILQKHIRKQVEKALSAKNAA